MRCKKCRSREMKNDYIKIIYRDGTVEYFCNQKCFDKFNNVKFRWNIDAIDSYVKWTEIYASGW